MRVVSILVLLWLIIGGIAAFQRGYFSSEDTSCAGLGSIALTIVAGPLNYVGVNPEVQNCALPQPSQ